MALHVLYVALGFHASHLQALWTSDDYRTMRSGHPGAMDLGEENLSGVEAPLAVPLMGMDRASESAGEELLGSESGVAWEADGEASPTTGAHFH